MDPLNVRSIKLSQVFIHITITSENKDGFYYNYSGNLVNKEIISTGGELNVTVGASKSGALVMKEIFIVVQTRSRWLYFRPVHEIIANSQNVKGLAIAILNPNTATAPSCTAR